MCFLPDFTLKIADFDTARFSGEEAVPESPSTLEGLLPYASPEIVQSAEFRQKLRYHASCDIWTAGILACELLTGRPVGGGAERDRVSVGSGFYGASPSMEYMTDVAADREPLPEIVCNDRHIRAFLQTLLQMDPSQRPAATLALEDDVFHTLDVTSPDPVEMQEAGTPRIST